MEDPSATLRSFDGTLAALEAAAAPLFDSSLNTLRDGLGGIDRAKLDVLLAYAINNLVWMYLKTRGVEPDDHEVSKELDRIKTYYAKVRDAESGVSTRRSKVDADAAHRFVLGNLPHLQKSKFKPSSSADSGPSTAAAAVAQRQAAAALAGPGRMDRFRHVAQETERIVVDGADAADGADDEDEDEDEEDEEEEEGESGDEEGEDVEMADAGADADALLASVDAQIGDGKGAQRKRKRPRALE